MKVFSWEKLLTAIEDQLTRFQFLKILDTLFQVVRITWSKFGIMKHKSQFHTISKALLDTLIQLIL